MKRLSLACGLIFLLTALPLARGATETSPAAAPAAAANFFTPEAIDWKGVLPPPPAVASLAALADLETVHQVQAARTPADIAWAKLIEKDDPYADFAEVLGPWLTEKNLPALAELIRQVTADAQAANKHVKNLHFRARPPAVDATVRPCVEIPTTNSYPSGHSLRANVWAGVLGDVFPDRADALAQWAHHVAWGRVIGGVHFPTDVVGGRIVAQAILVELRKNPAYRAAIEKARGEAAPFLQKKAA